MSKLVIKTKNLTKTFGKNFALNKLNLEVSEGEIFGYLGPNGAGKTTTIRLLMGFIRPSGGQAEVFGLSAGKDSVNIHKNIGYLPGEVTLYERLSGKDYLKFQASLRENVNWNYVQDLAQSLKATLEKPIKTLSHGNKQKIAIIAAFMHQPKLYILDEPTDGLDPLIQHEFYKLIAKVKSSGSSVFISSHNLPDVERICDRVGIIRASELVVTEEIENLKRRALRPIEVQFVNEIPESVFKKLPGIKNVRIDGKFLHCSVEGQMDSFIKELAKYEVVKIVTEEPNLEEIFLTYYA